MSISSCGTIPPRSKVISTGQRPKICTPSPVKETSSYEWYIFCKQQSIYPSICITFIFNFDWNSLNRSDEVKDLSNIVRWNIYISCLPPLYLSCSSKVLYSYTLSDILLLYLQDLPAIDARLYGWWKRGTLWKSYWYHPSEDDQNGSSHWIRVLIDTLVIIFILLLRYPKGRGQPRFSQALFSHQTI